MQILRLQWFYLAVLCLVTGLSVLGNDAPLHQRLPNFDKRQKGEARAERKAAADQLKARGKGVVVDFDEVSGAPKHIISREGPLWTRGAALRAPLDEHGEVKEFLRENAGLFGHGPEAIERARVKRDSRGRQNNARTVVWEQELDGIPVFEGILIAHTTREGDLASVSSQFVSNPELAAERGMPNWAAKKAKLPISQDMAGKIAARSLGGESRSLHAKLVWLPMSADAMRLVWEVYAKAQLGGEVYRLLVDAETGDIVMRHARTFYLSDATYNVFTGAGPAPMSPALATPATNQAPEVPRTMVTIAALSTNASPVGWIADGESETRGNNVDAHLDRNADDLPDLPRPQGGPDRVFNYPLDLTRSPETYGEAAAVNLFYWCNWMHDRLYELGFDEGAGNFQKDNFGRGGEGNDIMIANAQDGASVNNARYFPMPDGYPGRIEMFVWDGPDPDRDGDLDVEIILHEYTHGLTDRMVGGGASIYQLVTAGLAEGWSDFYALTLLNGGSDLNGNYTEGAYATYQLRGMTQNYYYGIRRYPYTTDMSKNPLTFKDIDRNQISSYPNVPRSPIHPFTPLVADEPHRAGELWCVTLWEMRANLIRKHGFPAGNELTLQLVTDGLKYSPPNPTFLQARDAIFQADRLLTSGANQSELWAAFAKRGMGLGAVDSGNWTTEGIRESFARPDFLVVVPSGPMRFSGPGGGPIDPICKTLTITNASDAAISWEASSLEPHFTLSASSGTLGPGQGAVLEVCPAAGALGLGVGAYATPFYVTNMSNGAIQRRDMIIQILHLATMPFAEDFEAGGLAPFWTLSGTGQRRTLLSTNNGPYAGAQHLTFASGAFGVYARNEATVALDLAGYTNVVLRLWAKEFKERPDGPPSAPFIESADFDGVAVSADGETWYEAAGLRRLREDYSEVLVALDETVARHGLGYNGQFRIRFNQAGTAEIPDGGIAIDNISITGSAPKRFVVSLPEIVQEGVGTISGLAAVNLPVAPAQDVTVNLSSGNPQAVTVPQTVILRAGTTSAAFDLNIADDDLLDGEQAVVIGASGAGHFAGESTLRVADNETAILTLTVGAQLMEGQGLFPGVGRVQLDPAPSRNLLVQLSSSDPAAVSVPAGVVMQAGQTSAVFNVVVGDDGAIDGPQTVSLTARLTEGIETVLNVSVLDNETTNLFVTLPGVVNEASTVLANVGSVRISGTLPTNVTASLRSSHTNKLRVPPAVTIPAGRLSTTFSVTLLDDSVGDASANVNITATADGFAPGTALVRVVDNDTAPLAYNPRPHPGSKTSARGVQLAWDLGIPELIVNGDFEAGNFSGWVKETSGDGDFVMNSGTFDPPGPEERSPPYSGRYSALSQQSSPGYRTISQTVSIPSFFDSAVLNWTHRIRNHAGEYSDSHFFRVEIRAMDGSLLAVPFSTQPGGPMFTDWEEHTFSLQDFRGGTIRIGFVESDSLGFLNVGLDNIRIFLSSPGAVTSEVYLGTTPNLGPAHFQGATTNTVWDLPPLTLDSPQYWQIITRRGDERVVNPVWTFSTRGIGPLHEFVWNPVATNQVMNRPFPAGIRATDADGNTISNFSRSVYLTGSMPESAEPVQVLTFTGFRATQREYRRTLAAISMHFTNYVETFFTATDPGVLEAQLAGKKVFLIVEQDAAPAERMAALGLEWAPVLQTFVANGGILIVCSYLRDEHEILNNSELMRLTKGLPHTSAQLLVAAGHPLTEGVSGLFTASNLSEYATEDGLILMALPGSTNGVVLTRQHGGGQVVMIGTDYNIIRTELDHVVANAVKLAQGPTSLPIPVAPPFTGYFVNGMWAGNVAVLAPGSNIVITADDGQGHTGRSIPLNVSGFNDLSVILMDSPDPVTLGSNLLYTAQVRNSGPASAMRVMLTFEVPPNLDILAANTSHGACTVIGDEVICDIGTLGSNGTAQVILDASAREAGTVQLTVVASASAEDFYSANDTDTAFTGVGYPSIFITGKSAPEGNSGSSTMTFPVQLRPPSSKTVTVHYAASNITATAGIDYVSQSGTITFAPGQTNQNVTFTYFGDRLYEGTETFAVYLFAPSNAILGEVIATGSLNEDDPAPALSILDMSLVEGADSTTTQAVFTVQLSTNAGVAVTADYGTSSGTASAIRDFVPVVGSLSIPAGTIATNVVVTVKGDRISETNETFVVKLSNAVHASLARSEGTATILDDDFGQLDRFALSTIPAEQQYGVPFPVTITARDALGNTATGFAGPVSLAGWAAARQSTVGPGDAPRQFPMGTYFHDQRLQVIYVASEIGEASRLTALALLVQTPPGQTLGRWTIRLKHSSLSRFDQPIWEQGWTTVYQKDESVTDGGWVTFQFNEPFEYNGVENLLVDFSFNNATYTADGKCDTIPTTDLRAHFFRTDSAYGDPLAWSGMEPPAELARWVPSVQFFAEQSIEIAPTVSGSFVDGVWNGNVTVFNVVKDMSLRAEDGENHSGLANFFSVVTTNDLAITASDTPDPIRAGGILVFTYQITNSGPASAGGLSLSNPMPVATSAILAQTSQGTCVVTDNLVLCDLGALAGGTTATVTVHAIPHESAFLTNTVFLSSNNEELYLGNNSATTVTRVNPRALMAADVTVTEQTAAFTNAVFNVRLSSASSNEVSVEYITSNVTATNGVDYLQTMGVLSFAPGVTNLSVIVPVIGDVSDEGSESFRLNLLNPTNAMLLSSTVTGTILDDDPPPVVTPLDGEMLEGNFGAAFFSFPVRISPASGLFASMTFTTSNGTATAGSDFFPQTLTTLIPPGFTNRVISTTIFGDRAVEPDETFFIHLSRLQNMTLTTNVARGTIFNDDGLPGVVETFAWSHVPSPQRVGTALPVTVEARDSYGNVATNFGGAALIRGRAGHADVTVGWNNAQSFNPMAASMHDNRTGAIYLTNELAGPRRISGLALEVLVPPGQPLHRWTIRMKHTTLNNFISWTAWETNGWTTVYQNDEVVDRTGWVPFTFQTPFDYNGTNNLLVDFSFDNTYFTVDGQCRFTATNAARTVYALSDSEAGDPKNWTAFPGPQVLLGFPTVQFISGSSVAVTPEVTAAFNRGVWTGAINVLDPASQMYLVADDAAGHVGFSVPFAAEFVADSDADGLLDEWELTYFGSLSANAGTDADGDGLTNSQEQNAGTNPVDGNSVLRVVSVEYNGATVNVRFTTVAGRTYRVETSDQLTSGSWSVVADNLPGVNDVLQVTDFGTGPAGHRFYRVRLLP